MTAVLWSRTDQVAVEFCKVIDKNNGWSLEGHVVLMASHPGWLDYRIECDRDWSTQSADVRGEVEGREISIEIIVEGTAWLVNEVEAGEVKGCVDVDLNFSPSTNLLPVKRLNLSVGESAEVRAAWLRFPSFVLESLEQEYTRVAENLYRYRSGNFEGELVVDDFGLPVDYAGVWKRVER